MSSEGIVIDQDQQYIGLNWSIVEDRINASNIQRGIISNQLLESVKNNKSILSKKLVLEIVSLSQQEQKVQDRIPKESYQP